VGKRIWVRFGYLIKSFRKRVGEPVAVPTIFHVDLDATAHIPSVKPQPTCSALDLGDPLADPAPFTDVSSENNSLDLTHTSQTTMFDHVMSILDGTIDESGSRLLSKLGFGVLVISTLFLLKKSSQFDGPEDSATVIQLSKDGMAEAMDVVYKIRANSRRLLEESETELSADEASEERGSEGVSKDARSMAPNLSSIKRQLDMPYNIDSLLLGVCSSLGICFLVVANSLFAN
jgi:hypothetical protein